MPMRGLSHFSMEKLLSNSTEKLCREPFYVSQKLWCRKSFQIRGGGGKSSRERVSRLHVKSFLSHSAEKFRGGTLQSFINFGYRKFLCFCGEYQDFLWKICCLTVPKNFVGVPFCVSQSFWCQKNLWKRRGVGRREGGSRFKVKNFCLTILKKFVGEIYCAVFQKCSGSHKVYG